MEASLRFTNYGVLNESMNTACRNVLLMAFLWYLCRKFKNIYMLAFSNINMALARFCLWKCLVKTIHWLNFWTFFFPRVVVTQPFSTNFTQCTFKNEQNMQIQAYKHSFSLQRWIVSISNCPGATSAGCSGNDMCSGWIMNTGFRF